ncbi:MAG: fasciclin domain-containing protein [Sphingobacteriales bacterium]|nr:fasciclin domain-containing protein [Sphingobacteriales bacterium]
MKKFFNLVLLASALLLGSCNNKPTETPTPAAENTAGGGQEAIQDDVSQKDVVKVAVGSPDHTTLVAALKQAELVTSLSNAGPFTVFAPTNAAFDKLPAGTVDELMKEDKKTDLQNILQYHVTTSALDTKFLTDGMSLGMVNGDNATISVKEGKILLNGSASIVASVRASNGWVHVIDGVLLPPAKK